MLPPISAAISFHLDPAAPQMRDRIALPAHPVAMPLTHRIVFAHDHSPFRMPGERPANPAVLQLRRADLAGERSVRLVEHVLRRHFDLLAEVLARQ